MVFYTIANIGDVIEREDGVTGVCVKHQHLHEETCGVEIEAVIWLVYCKDYDRNVIAVMDDGQKLQQENHTWKRLRIRIDPKSQEVIYG